MSRANFHLAAITFLYLVTRICLIHTEQVKQCISVENENGFYLAGFSTQSFVTESLNQCFTSCRDSERCQSINFSYRTRQCDFNNETKRSRPNAVVRREGMSYVDNLFRGEETEDNLCGKNLNFELAVVLRIDKSVNRFSERIELCPLVAWHGEYSSIDDGFIDKIECVT